MSEPVQALAGVPPTGLIPLRLDERRAVRRLAVVTATLVVVGFLGQLAELLLPDFPGRDLIASLTDLNGETNLPATFNALLLLGAAVILGVISGVKRALRDAHASSWRALALIFGFLTVDEAASIHERTILVTHQLLGADGFLKYAWVVPYGALALAVLLAFLRFLAHLPPAIRRRVVLAGALYVTGAIGFELLEGQVDTLLGTRNVPMQVFIACEEALEMSGLLVFIAALLRYVRVYLPGVGLQVGLTPPASRR